VKNCYKVHYVGDDSLGHSMVVRAKNHDEAIAKVKKATDADVVTGIRRCANPYAVAACVVLASLVLIALFVLSC